MWLARTSRRERPDRRGDRDRRRRRQRRQSLHLAEMLECRRLFTASLAGGVLTVTGTVNNDVIHLGIINGTDYQVVFTAGGGGATQTFALGAVDSIIVNSGDGHDSTFIDQAQDPVAVNGGNGIDDVELGFGPSELSQIGVTVTFNGGADADYDQVGLWDGPSSGTVTWNVTSNAVTRSGWGGQVIYQACNGVQISGGEANDVFNMQQFPAGMTAKMYGNAGDDVLNLASAGENLDALGAAYIMFAGGDGSGDSIQWSDQLANNGTLYAITATEVWRLSGVHLDMEYYDAESMVINGEAGPNSYTVSGLPANMPTTIKGGGGDDWLVAGGGVGSGNFSNLQSPLYWDGQAGYDTATYDDSKDTTNHTFTVTGSTVSMSGPTTSGGFSYGDAEKLELNGPKGAAVTSTYRIVSTPAGRPFNIKAGSGNDTFVVGGGSPISGAGGNLDPLAGPLVIDGGTGAGTYDTIRINDSGNLRGDGYLLTATGASRDYWAGGLSYSNAEQVSLRAGDGGNYIRLKSAPTNAPVTVQGGGGDDIIEIGAVNQTINGIYGSHWLYGDAGNDSLVVNDSQNTGAVVWNIDDSTVQRLPEDGHPGSLLSYLDMEQLILKGGMDGDSIRINTTNYYTPVIIDPGATMANEDSVTVVDMQGPTPITILPTAPGATRVMSVFVNTDGVGEAAVTFPQSIRLANLYIYNGGTVNVPAGANALLHVMTSMIMYPQAKLDLADNDLAINYSGSSPIGAFNGSIYTGWAGQIQRANDFGAWDGFYGITTSMGQATTGLTTLGIGEASAVFGISGAETAEFDGATIDATTVLVKYTYSGDANLDGVVDGGDYGIIDNFAQTPGASGYFNGDCNYDGVIDGGDYGVIDNNLQAQGPPL